MVTGLSNGSRLSEKKFYEKFYEKLIFCYTR